jgi:hypothetical protein
MNPWLVYPTWQHYSSFFREVTAAADESNNWLRCHHLNSALYFSISFIEALLNEKYRVRLENEGWNEADILPILRKGSSSQNPKKGRTFVEKFTEWPSLITGKNVIVSPALQKVLTAFNEMRGNLTHPKSRGFNLYDELEVTDPQHLFESVAEYAITMFSALDQRYPYWLCGWNYLNPTKTGYEPLLLNDQQFLHSLDYLGLDVPSFDADTAEVWKKKHFESFIGFKTVRQLLAGCPPCEPFDPDLPLRPRLVKTWWDLETFQKHKNLIKRRTAPYFCGAGKIAGSLIGIQFSVEPIAD